MLWLVSYSYLVPLDVNMIQNASYLAKTCVLVISYDSTPPVRLLTGHLATEDVSPKGTRCKYSWGPNSTCISDQENLSYNDSKIADIVCYPDGFLVNGMP